MDVLFYVPVAQLDRALDSDSKGRWFESSRAYHNETLEALGFRGFIFSMGTRESTHCLFLLDNGVEGFFGIGRSFSPSISWP